MIWNVPVTNLCPIRPTDFQFRHKDLYYKIGTHGFLFVWVRGGWNRSTIDKSRGTMNAKDERLSKILGILQLCSTRKINIVEVKLKYQFFSGNTLLLELSNKEFYDLTVHDILERME